MNDKNMIRYAAAIGFSLGTGIKPPVWVNDNYDLAQRTMFIAKPSKANRRIKTKKTIMVRIDNAIAIGALTALAILTLESVIGIAFW